MKLAIVGLGNQGRKRQHVAAHDVVATVDPVVANAAYRRIEDVPLDSYEAACACTPDATKVACLRYLLAHGKHVLVEKPLLASEQEFEELSELIQRHRVTLYTAYNHRFEPHLVRVRDCLQQGELGSLYLLRLFYGNGTARDVRDSVWRDKGSGVLTDLGSHLLDLVDFLVGLKGRQFTAWCLDRYENRALDHVLFGSNQQPTLVLEATLSSWRNTFQLDVFGELGSLHVNCLCKWGPSTLTLRRRVLPSGRPQEETETIESADPTWQAEYEHFKKLCESGKSNLDTDRMIQAALDQVITSQEGIVA
jgi:scyllo-inositol 2-dehydrogenase (NADP+)